MVLRIIGPNLYCPLKSLGSCVECSLSVECSLQFLLYSRRKSSYQPFHYLLGLWDIMSTDQMSTKKKLNFKNKSNTPHRSWTLYFFRLRTLALLVSVNGIFRKLCCRHYVCIPFASIVGVSH